MLKKFLVLLGFEEDEGLLMDEQSGYQLYEMLVLNGMLREQADQGSGGNLGAKSQGGESGGGQADPYAEIPGGRDSLISVLRGGQNDGGGVGELAPAAGQVNEI